MQVTSDPRRSNKIVRFKCADPQSTTTAVGEDALPEYMNVLGMIFSMCGLMMRVSSIVPCRNRMKWCAWMALLCSCVSFANTRSTDDAKQIVSSFMSVEFFCSLE
uniref:Protein Asterix n=1 Tax=Heterorhabditis bacteriophora TaxID=37862 RepID=A0A1I7WL29_HETBA